MSLLIKALDKAQEAKAQEVKAQEVKTQEKEARDAGADSVAKRKPQVLDDDASQPAINSNMDRVSATNALEFELSPIPQTNTQVPEDYDKKVQENPDVFAITSTFKLQQSASTKNALSANKTPVTNKLSPANRALANSSTSANSAAGSAATNFSASGSSAKSAANVFAAKRIESNNQNTILALVAAVALCLMLMAGGYYYLLMNDEPDFVIAKRPNISPMPSPANTVPDSQIPNSQVITETQSNLQTQNLPDQLATQSVIEKPSASISAQPVMQSSASAGAAITSKQSAPVENVVNQTAKASMFRDESLAENEVVLNDLLIERTSAEKPIQSARNTSRTIEVGAIASKSASIQVSKNQSEMGVNSILMDAYNAYNAGKDTVAGKLYRQVLQRDIRNVDALLGLGAIAQRQGRITDANGWYAKVLEVEPRNALASTSILENQPQNDVANSESRIKSMLAKYPDDANLHTTLGHFYADLNQWNSAQQAYFDAYRLNASADNAFNLAVSLDQLGKPKLALPYYQTALQLAQTSGSNMDKNALEARIAAIR